MLGWIAQNRWFCSTLFLLENHLGWMAYSKPNKEKHTFFFHPHVCGDFLLQLAAWNWLNSCCRQPESWSGKGVPSGEGGGGAARVWRDNLRLLQQYYNPDISVSLWLNHLSLYCSSTWPEVGQKGEWESNRVFLEKVKEKVAPGLHIFLTPLVWAG